MYSMVVQTFVREQLHAAMVGLISAVNRPATLATDDTEAGIQNNTVLYTL